MPDTFFHEHTTSIRRIDYTWKLRKEEEPYLNTMRKAAYQIKQMNQDYWRNYYGDEIENNQ